MTVDIEHYNSCLHKKKGLTDGILIGHEFDDGIVEEAGRVLGNSQLVIEFRESGPPEEFKLRDGLFGRHDNVFGVIDHGEEGSDPLLEGSQPLGQVRDQVLMQEDQVREAVVTHDHLLCVNHGLDDATESPHVLHRLILFLSVGQVPGLPLLLIPGLHLLDQQMTVHQSDPEGGKDLPQPFDHCKVAKLVHRGGKGDQDLHPVLILHIATLSLTTHTGSTIATAVTGLECFDLVNHAEHLVHAVIPLVTDLGNDVPGGEEFTQILLLLPIHERDPLFQPFFKVERMVIQELDAGRVDHDLLALAIGKGSGTEVEGEALALIAIAEGGDHVRGHIPGERAHTELTNGQLAGRLSQLPVPVIRGVKQVGIQGGISG